MRYPPAGTRAHHQGGQQGGVGRLPPPELLSPQGLTTVWPQNLQEFRSSNCRSFKLASLASYCPRI
jgi:hypothetical protein